MLKKLLQIFRTGAHTASDGRSYKFTEADLGAVAEAYDPALHEAPLVVGHPKQDAPAYGWVKRLTFNADFLEAEHDRVDPQFAELVEQGRFNKISASFYPPESPHNPKPGVYYLRHVGFLGAQPPAIKGLPSPAFSDEEDYIEFADMTKAWFYSTIAVLLRRLRDYFIDTTGLEKADEIMPDYQVRDLEEAAANAMTTADNYSEPETEEVDDMSAEEQARLAKLEAENAKLKADALAFAEREQQLAAAEAARGRAAIVEFAESLVKQGRVLPKDQPALVEFMAALDAGTVIEFAEGDNQVKKPGKEWLESFLQTLPVQVNFTEVAGAGNESAELDTADARAIADKALEFKESERQAGREISIATAVQRITANAA